MRANPDEPAVPLVLRMPGLRRYAAQIRKLRADVARAKKELRQLRASQAQAADDQQLLQLARQYRYYWVRAAKKIDVRNIAPFGELADRIIRDGRTFLDVDRLYTLWQAACAMPPGAQAVVEVGVYKGGSARFVAETLRASGRELPFYVCDTFGGHAEVDPSLDGRHRPGQQFIHVKVGKVLDYLAPFEFIQVVRGDFRETSASLEQLRDVGLAHLDVDVYPTTRFCLEFFAGRMVRGGWVVVDDYGTKKCPGVKNAVDEFIARDSRFSRLHLLTGQAVLIRLDGG